jgi:hypothetical protein
MVGVFGCACAANGNATIPFPKSEMNVRRFMYAPAKEGDEPI